MAQAQLDYKSAVSQLNNECVEAFCEDLGMMFGNTMESQQSGEPAVGKISDLKTNFKKLSAVFSVASEGGLQGNFYLVLDKVGLFAVAGTFVMLPENMILNHCKTGTVKEAAEIGDALGEVGNLMVGSWDRIFREGFSSHGHFVQAGTHVGDGWQSTQEALGVGEDDDVLIQLYELKIDEYPSMKFAAVYPLSIFTDINPPKTEVEQTQPDQDQQLSGNESAQSQSSDIQAATEDNQQKTLQPAAQVIAEQEVADSQEVSDAQAQSQDQKVDQTQAALVDDSQSASDADEEVQQQVVQSESELQQEIAGEDNESGDSSQGDDSESLSQGNGAAEGKDDGPVSDAIKRLTKSLMQEKVGGDHQVDTVQHVVFKGLTVADVMNSSVQWAKDEDTVEHVGALMQQNNCGYVLVGEDGKLEGIVSMSDIRGATSPYLQAMFLKWRRPLDLATLQIKVKWIMSKPVKTICPDADVSEAMAKMCQNKCRALPVVDSKGVVSGILTVFDIFNSFLSQKK